MAAPSTAIDQIADLLASRGLASFEPKIGESLIPDSDRIFLPGADLISDELGQFPKGTRAHVRVSTVAEAHVRNHQRISFPELWKLLAMQRLSGNECRKHRSSRRTGAGLSVTGLQQSANFNLPWSCHSRAARGEQHAPFIASRRPQAHRTWMRQPARCASPIVCTP